MKVWILADEIVDERGLNVGAASHLQVLEAGLQLPQPLQKASAGTKYKYLRNSMTSNGTSGRARLLASLLL